MSATEKPAAGAAPDPLLSYVALAERLFVGLAARIYSAPSSAENKKPDPKALAAMCFKLADAFEAATKEPDRAKAIIDAKNKAAVRLDDVDLSGVFASE